LATVHQRHRQTGQDRQRSDSIGRTVLQTVAQKSSPEKLCSRPNWHGEAQLRFISVTACSANWHRLHTSWNSNTTLQAPVLGQRQL